MNAPTLEALLDITQIGEAAGLMPDEARVLMDLRGVQPVAAYRGKPLWFSDAVHDILEETPACERG